MKEQKLTFSRFVDWGFLTLVAGVVGYGSTTLVGLENSITELRKEIGLAMTQLASVQTMTQEQNARADRIEDRINDLENRRR